MPPTLLLAAWLAACKGSSTPESAYSQACQDLCDILVVDCGYDAFPSYDSCLEGCAWDESQGADVAGEYRCVRDADCDTFAVLECQHAYGVEGD